MKRIYLDYAATSPVRPEVAETMRPYFREKFGNPSSLHAFGRETRAAIDRARQQMAEFLHCRPEEVIFTSGGTESDNLALRGVINYKLQIINQNLKFNKPHIITSAFEHHAVLHTCEDLEKQGLVEVTYIKPDREGIIHLEDVEKAIRPNTVLVSIMYVNNEIGTVQPISELRDVIESRERSKTKDNKNYHSQLTAHNPHIYFHTDAVQAIEYFDCDVQRLGVDMLSLSAHKFGGPKGVGALFVKKGTPLKQIQTGGMQEFNHRAGTENVAGIIGMAKAIQLLNKKSNIKNKKLLELRNHFIDSVLRKIPHVVLNGSREKRSPNNVNFGFKNVEGESILLNLDLLGIAASSGSACTSGSLEPSHVLQAIGIPDELSHGAVRFTLGEQTTRKEIDFVLQVLPGIIKKLRKISPYR